MNKYYLSYLMGGGSIRDEDLWAVGVEIVETAADGDRKIKIPQEVMPKYIELIKSHLNPGFWNEAIGAEEIVFIFKLKDGMIQEYKLSLANEKNISELCSELNGDSLEKTANVYKYIAGNEFYRDFMQEHYADLINR